MSSLTLQLVTHDYPRPTDFGVLGYDDRGRLVIARTAPMLEPLSIAQYKKAVSGLVTAWFVPELFSDGDDAVHTFYESVVERT